MKTTIEATINQYDLDTKIARLRVDGISYRADLSSILDSEVKKAFVSTTKSRFTGHMTKKVFVVDKLELDIQ